MKTLLIVTALGLALGLQACNRTEEGGAAGGAASTDGTASTAPVPSGAPAAEAATGPFRTAGRVASVTGSAVTIDHEAVEGLGWPAMTMTFQAPDPAMLQGIEAGTAVEFSFRKEGEQYVLTEVAAR